MRSMTWIEPGYFGRPAGDFGQLDSFIGVV